jgi:hypothetical protein
MHSGSARCRARRRRDLHRGLFGQFRRLDARSGVADRFRDGQHRAGCRRGRSRRRSHPYGRQRRRRHRHRRQLRDVAPRVLLPREPRRGSVLGRGDGHAAFLALAQHRLRALCTGSRRGLGWLELDPAVRDRGPRDDRRCLDAVRLRRHPLQECRVSRALRTHGGRGRCLFHERLEHRRRRAQWRLHGS